MIIRDWQFRHVVATHDQIQLETGMRSILIVLSGLLGFAAPAQAGETPWQAHLDMLQTRIVTTSADMTDADGMPLLAWEAKLAPGWKTYWRSPGEAGLPVRISQDGTDIDILFPVPERFELFGLETYGYSHAVLLPFRPLSVSDGGVSVSASFMVCKDICVPFDATYDVPASALGADFSPHDIRVSTWMEKVPARAGDGGAGLAIDSVRVAGPVGRQHVVVDAHADAMLTAPDMLAEVNDMVHFGAPKIKITGDGRSARFVLAAMTGKKPMDLRGEQIRLTFIDGQGHAIERILDLPEK